jgi:hypothetical protein
MSDTLIGHQGVDAGLRVIGDELTADWPRPIVPAHHAEMGFCCSRRTRRFRVSWNQRRSRFESNPNNFRDRSRVETPPVAD